MATVLSTLFPPVVATFMPAFVNTQDAVVYFSISPFNSSSEIERVHVTLTNQTNNESALSNASGVLIQNLMPDPSGSGMYYVTIPATALKSGNSFNINQFYKVQLRFDCYNAGAVPNDDTQLNYYLLQNQEYFSEWSTICLIKPILEPEVYLRQFDTETAQKVVSFNKGIVPISGRVVFGGSLSSAETETLQSYTISIVDAEENVLYKTKEIYTGAELEPNIINYKLDLQSISLENADTYFLRLNLTTKNQYTFTKDYEFQISNYIDNDGFSQYTTFEVTMDDENAIANVHIKNDVGINGTLYVKRASSVDNFQTWESISTTKVNGSFDMNIEDNTVGSLVWYRYSLQLENSAGAFTKLLRTAKFLPNFYDAVLSRGSQQLAIRYDFNISNLKPVVNRSKIDTLGGRYPKFAENAILNYKQFNISGYISSEADFNQKFLDKSSYYGDNYLNYQVYLEDEDIESNYRNDTLATGSDEFDVTHLSTTANDWMWERDFREAALAWLNDGEPKLLRTMTEGVIPVMLTDISLTPNTSLGRRLYTFSATAYEIADGNSLSTLDELGIIEVPTVDSTTTGSGGGGNSDDTTTVTKIGQIYQEKVSGEKLNIVSNAIASKIKEKYAGVLKDKMADNFYIKSVRIQFHSKPSIFKVIDNSLKLADYSDIKEYNANKFLFGYSFDLTTDQSITSQRIFVNSSGYYQIPDNIKIKELSFPQTTDEVTVDYVVVYNETASAASIIAGSTVQDTVVGQYSGVFEYDSYLGDTIRKKYTYVYDNVTQKMRYWRGLSLDVEPYAIAHIKYQNESEYKDYVVGQSGILNLLKDFPIQDMSFRGRRIFIKSSDRKEYLTHYECVILNETYSTTKEVPSPIDNCVYTIDSQQMIYYHSDWYRFDDNGDGTGIARVPVQGMINYLGDIVISESAG
jgi:hypothetical protein